MTIPTDKKDQAVYHTILAEMHRLHATMLNRQVMAHDQTEAAILEHFGRQQTLALGKLVEWKGRRPEIYAQAAEDFRHQVRPPDGGE